MAETPVPRPPLGAGGFLPPSARSQTLPSPAPSTASSRAAARLPAPRSRPLAPGSRKEDYARDYVSQRLLHVSRRYVKKHGIPNDDGVSGDPAEVPGYDSADELCRDLEDVVDVLWFSGTPSLQIPYLINVAHALTTYLASFAPAPRPTFALLQKLDHCFASLLVGRDVKTRDPLPGFQRGLGAGLSRTDMVRLKSIADETRILVAVVMSGEADVEDDSDNDDDDNNNVKKGVDRDSSNFKDEGDDALVRMARRDDRILDPFEAAIDPGEGVVYGLKPESDYGGFVGEEDTDDEDQVITVPQIKKEDQDEEDDDDDEGDEFVDVADPEIIPKRKVDDDAELSDKDAEEGDPKKRVKVKVEEQEALDPMTHGGDETGDRIRAEDEDAGEETPNLDRRPINGGASSKAPLRPTTVFPVGAESAINNNSNNETPTSHNDNGNKNNKNNNNNNNNNNNISVTNGASQFHFALDDEESDSDGEALPNTNGGPPPGHRQQHQHQPQEDDIDEDDEDEELHMNVARVYAKTLVQLGKTLGELIADE
ncbi:hypothetical protein DL766_008579 [Monosporascus sp. MC13-8B]|uniref:Meiotic recombination protein DMC1 n=1 Tax=Monosporascus cannonballus TaxID=155416 RepID=A0ABY0GUM9_9PEZI|nr:hypothetical protein DL763_011128 [Monosporascus cannonballus]RYO77485.1 hypothetical protein DL762_009238 [Monosporascus cannonballus]RYP18858.1 hypothetical protein DL766_008579 [Monosporascus sp. MC13-8B]